MHHLGWAAVKDGRFVLPRIGPGRFILSIYKASASDPMTVLDTYRTVFPESVSLGDRNVSDGFEVPVPPDQTIDVVVGCREE